MSRHLHSGNRAEWRRAVSWAELWAKIKERHERSWMFRARSRFVMFGAVFAALGASGLYSDTVHHIKGKAATATLMEHIEQYTVAYQRVGEEKRNETWPCDQVR